MFTSKEIKIKKSGINEKNEYGNFLHAIINYEYPQDTKLIIIEKLLKTGIDINHKAESTGYTFLHLALYGYTDDSGIDHSYSTEFILQLIKLAKKYGFDWNNRDHDDETVIMSSLASEVYTGSIIELLKEVPISNPLEFVISYKKYLNESKSNANWNKHLENEKNEIIEFVLDKLLNELKEKDRDYTPDDLKKNKQELLSIYEEIEQLQTIGLNKSCKNKLKEYKNVVNDLQLDQLNKRNSISNEITNLKEKKMAIAMAIKQNIEDDTKFDMSTMTVEELEALKNTLVQDVKQITKNATEHLNRIYQCTFEEANALVEIGVVAIEDIEKSFRKSIQKAKK